MQSRRQGLQEVDGSLKIIKGSGGKQGINKMSQRLSAIII